jgi:steroid 5-alpha reductase family enzyme
MHPLLLSYTTILVCVCLLYVLSRFIKNNAIVDIFWGPGFGLVALVSFFYYMPLSSAHLIFLAMILAWAIRLGAHIYIKNKGKGEDFRYAKWRQEWGAQEPVRALLQIYLLQGSIMFVMSMVIVFIFSKSQNDVAFRWLHLMGILIFTVGFLMETIADKQKSDFKKLNPTGKIMQSGIWKYSRHPNYVGEVILWFGLFIYSIPSGYGYLGLLSFAIIFYLIRFVSGVPMLEKAKENNAEYQAYAQKTPIFFPFTLSKKN